MSKLDLGLIDGNDWDAAAVDAIEAGVNRNKITGTEAERLALTGHTVGQLFQTTDAAVSGVGGPRLWVYDGTGWIILHEPVQAWSTTWTALTKGNGQDKSWYRRTGGLIKWAVNFTFGTTTSITGAPLINYPVAVHADDTEQIMQAIYLDSGVQRYNGFCVTASSGSAALATLASPAASIGATVPHNWGTNDGIFIRPHHMRMTSPYS